MARFYDSWKQQPTNRYIGVPMSTDIDARMKEKQEEAKIQNEMSMYANLPINYKETMPSQVRRAQELKLKFDTALKQMADKATQNDWQGVADLMSANRQMYSREFGTPQSNIVGGRGQGSSGSGRVEKDETGTGGYGKLTEAGQLWRNNTIITQEDEEAAKLMATGKYDKYDDYTQRIARQQAFDKSGGQGVYNAQPLQTTIKDKEINEFVQPFFDKMRESGSRFVASGNGYKWIQGQDGISNAEGGRQIRNVMKEMLNNTAITQRYATEYQGRLGFNELNEAMFEQEGIGPIDKEGNKQEDWTLNMQLKQYDKPAGNIIKQEGNTVITDKGTFFKNGDKYVKLATEDEYMRNRALGTIIGYAEEATGMSQHLSGLQADKYNLMQLAWNRQDGKEKEEQDNLFKTIMLQQQAQTGAVVNEPLLEMAETLLHDASNFDNNGNLNKDISTYTMTYVPGGGSTMVKKKISGEAYGQLIKGFKQSIGKPNMRDDEAIELWKTSVKAEKNRIQNAWKPANNNVAIALNERVLGKDGIVGDIKSSTISIEENGVVNNYTYEQLLTKLNNGNEPDEDTKDKLEKQITKGTVAIVPFGKDGGGYTSNLTTMDGKQLNIKVTPDNTTKLLLQETNKFYNAKVNAIQLGQEQNIVDNGGTQWKFKPTLEGKEVKVDVYSKVPDEEIKTYKILGDKIGWKNTSNNKVRMLEQNGNVIAYKQINDDGTTTLFDNQMQPIEEFIEKDNKGNEKTVYYRGRNFDRIINAKQDLITKQAAIPAYQQPKKSYELDEQTLNIINSGN